MNYFGEPYPTELVRAPVYEDGTQVDTPVGGKCWYCERLIEEGDRGFILAGPDEHGTIVHRKCLLFSVLGEDLAEHVLREELARPWPES